MKRKSRKLSEEQKKQLLQSPNVETVGNSVLTYKPEFKIKAIEEYLQGKSPVQIFTDAEIDVQIIGSKNAFNLIKKWMKSQEKPKAEIKKELTLQEKLKVAETRIEYLEAELDFRKKLQALEEM